MINETFLKFRVSRFVIYRVFSSRPCGSHIHDYLSLLCQFLIKIQPTKPNQNKPKEHLLTLAEFGCCPRTIKISPDTWKKYLVRNSWVSTLMSSTNFCIKTELRGTQICKHRKRFYSFCTLSNQYRIWHTAGAQLMLGEWGGQEES